LVLNKIPNPFLLSLGKVKLATSVVCHDEVDAVPQILGT